MRRLGMHLSPSMVIACVALLVALGGVANGTLQAIDFARNQLPAGPAGLTGPIGPGDALYDTNPGPVTVFTFDTRVATLPIPAAGTYVIWSKVWLVRSTAGQPTVQRCVLRSTDGAEDPILSTGPRASPTMMANLLVHEFGGPGTVNLFCYATGQSVAFSAKIAAIKVGSLRTTTG